MKAKLIGYTQVHDMPEIGDVQDLIAFCIYQFL